MGKRSLIFILFCLLSATLWGCQDKQTDGLRFKREYEALNGQKSEEGRSYPEMTIPDDSTVIYEDGEKILESLENGTHVVYMGWPECPYCRSALPVLLEAVSNHKGVNIHYYNIKAAREAYESGKNSSLAETYEKIIAALNRDDFDLSDYVNFYDDGTIRYPSSLILFIREGEIVAAHRRTVASQLDGYEPLSSSQRAELLEIYEDCLGEMLRDIRPGCNIDC